MGKVWVTIAGRKCISYRVMAASTSEATTCKQDISPVWGCPGGIALSQTLPDVLFEPTEQGFYCRLGLLNINSLTHPKI